MTNPDPATTSRWRLLTSHVSVRMTVWLVVVWVVLRAEYTLVSLLIGIILALVAQVAFPMPHLGIITRVRPLWLLVLFGHFVVDMVVAAVQVSWLVLRPAPVASRAVIIPLRSQSALFLTIGTALTSLVPGTVVMDAHLRPATIHLHVLDLPMAGGVAGVHRSQLKLEERIMWALASRKELHARGISRPGRYSPMARHLEGIDADHRAIDLPLRDGSPS
ncbi:Na+/H+ antiporter subunit E [Nanchangia anserum]|uniref:Na+/H+ antiporter subunit E n=2 Tax=Nanchangia anserum TaxID=2692125 RepID=A0A8I0KRB7_9ACTO|nr:Na+/H+ antiporter subunit E [Nanchangia anserum]MBD3689272.1 Na+/H+ antiporter subunit E [Nanchangia anserum]QOX81492.1 Na+/H+ antiporter subunit E [Nanchangia anserum]